MRGWHPKLIAIGSILALSLDSEAPRTDRAINPHLLMSSAELSLAE